MTLHFPDTICSPVLILVTQLHFISHGAYPGGKKKSPLGNTIKFPIASKRQGGRAVGNLHSEILLLLLHQAEFTKDI